MSGNGPDLHSDRRAATRGGQALLVLCADSPAQAELVHSVPAANPDGQGC